MYGNIHKIIEYKKHNHKMSYESLSRWNEKHSSKQGVSRTYTLEEKFFTAATFEGLEVVSFKT